MSKSHESIIEIKATPEQVFRAITEAPEIAKWFAPIARVDPRVGGEYFFSWGPGMEGSTTITAWDPYTHFGTCSERSITYGSKGKPVDTGRHAQDGCRLLHRSARRRCDAAEASAVRLRSRGCVG